MGLFDNIFGKNNEPQQIKILGKEYEVNSEAMDQCQIGLNKYLIKDYIGSIDAFSKAINLMPKNQNFYTMRGTAYEDMGNDIEAEKDFRKTLEYLPNDYVSSYRLGMVFFRKKDFENAIKWLKVSYDNVPEIDLENNEKNNIMFIAKKLIAGNLGNFLTQVKRYKESFVYLDEAINLDPSYPNPYLAKGLALAQLGNINEGILYLEKAEKLGASQATIIIQMLKNQAAVLIPPIINPLNITNDEALAVKHHIPNLIPLYEGDVVTNLSRLQTLNDGLIPEETTELLVYMTIDNFIEYKSKCGILPMSVLTNVKNQIRQAFVNVYIDRGFLKQILQDFDHQIMEKVWHKNIEVETQVFMEKLDNKYFI